MLEWYQEIWAGTSLGAVLGQATAVVDGRNGGGRLRAKHVTVVYDNAGPLDTELQRCAVRFSFQRWCFKFIPRRPHDIFTRHTTFCRGTYEVFHKFRGELVSL